MRSTVDLKMPVSSIMTHKLETVNPKDSLHVVKDIFNLKRIHHIPVVRYKTLVGMISHSDFLHFMHGMHRSKYDEQLEESRLRNYTAEDIMETDLCTLEPGDNLEVAIEIFRENLFHAIPIVEEDELAGILTPIDIMNLLIQEQ